MSNDIPDDITIDLLKREIDTKNITIKKICLELQATQEALSIMGARHNCTPDYTNGLVECRKAFMR